MRRTRLLVAAVLISFPVVTGQSSFARPKTPARSLGLTPRQLAAVFSAWGYAFPARTRFSKDEKLYPSSTALGYGSKLTVTPGRGRSLIMDSTQVDATPYVFHRVNYTSDGGATYHPGSDIERRLLPDETGALQLPERLSTGLQIPKGKNQAIVLANPSRTGDLLDVVLRGPGGRLRRVSYELSGARFGKLSAVEADRRRAASAFRSSSHWPAPAIVLSEPVLEAAPSQQPVARSQQPVARRPQAVQSPRTAPEARGEPRRRPDPDEFWTVQEAAGGFFEVYRGSRRTGIAVMQREFRSRPQADRYIRQQDGSRLLFSNGNRDAPIW